MKKVAFYTNMPSPYRVEFFNLLGQHCDLYVFFEMKASSSRDPKWFSDNCRSFHAVFLRGIKYSGEAAFCPGIVREFKKVRPDINVVCNMSSLSGMLLVDYFNKHKINYVVEGDGAFSKPSSKIKTKIKKRILSNAEMLLFTSDEHKDYLLRFGGEEKRMFHYPFSSILSSQIVEKPAGDDNKKRLRNELGIKNMTTFVSVGRFIPLKDFSTLIKAFKKYDEGAQLLLIGGKPTKEYQNIISTEGIKNIHFVDFQEPNKLFKYMQASDCFVFSSLCDVWGLVINEAMAVGLPVISSSGALAARELSKNNNGVCIYQAGNIVDLQAKIDYFLSLSEEEIHLIANQNLQKIKEYTLEEMCDRHVNLLNLSQN